MDGRSASKVGTLAKCDEAFKQLLEDLNEAIELIQEAVSLTPANHDSRSAFLTILGDLFFSKNSLAYETSRRLGSGHHGHPGSP